MKSSGNPWIGDVPEGWEVRRLRYLAEITTGNKDTQDAQPDGNYPFYVRSPVIERSNEYTFEGPGIMMAGDGAGAGRIFHYADGKYAVHQRVYRIYDFKDVTACFLLYFLGAMFPLEMDKGSAQSTVPSVRLPMLRDLQVSLPPLPVQRAIAVYLDDKCGAIDGAVDELKRGIEYCKAWKKAIITEVTSVGLDDDVKLWQTELGWISNRPSYWKRNQLSSLCRRGITYGIVKLGEPCENGVKVLRCSDVKDGYLDASNVRTVTPELSDEYKRTVLSGGEVIVNVRGTLGGCAIVPKEFSGANIAREVALLDVEESKANPKFVMYTLLSSCFANYVGHEMAGAIYQGLNIATLSKYSFYAPDIKEQQAIADYLDEKCAAIDALVAEKEKLIADLEAYKKSLIFELVTGKKEVKQK